MRQLEKNRHFTNYGVVSVNAFHEKAGRSQVEFFILLATIFLFARSPLAAAAMLRFALSRSDRFARCRLGVLVSAGAAT